MTFYARFCLNTNFILNCLESSFHKTLLFHHRNCFYYTFFLFMLFNFLLNKMNISSVMFAVTKNSIYYEKHFKFQKNDASLSSFIGCILLRRRRLRQRAKSKQNYFNCSSNPGFIDLGGGFRPSRFNFCT